MKVSTIVLTPGQWDGEFPDPNVCWGLTQIHHWILMSPPPNPIWYCDQCRRIEQRILVEEDQ